VVRDPVVLDVLLELLQLPLLLLAHVTYETNTVITRKEETYPEYSCAFSFFFPHIYLIYSISTY